MQIHSLDWMLGFLRRVVIIKNFMEFVMVVIFGITALQVLWNREDGDWSMMGAEFSMKRIAYVPGVRSLCRCMCRRFRVLNQAHA